MHNRCIDAIPVKYLHCIVLLYPPRPITNHCIAAILDRFIALSCQLILQFPLVMHNRCIDAIPVNIFIGLYCCIPPPPVYVSQIYSITYLYGTAVSTPPSPLPNLCNAVMPDKIATRCLVHT